MSHLSIPPSIADAPAASQPLLEEVKKMFGVAPNLFRLVATSPAALEGYLGLLSALGKGALPIQTRQRVAIAVAAVNGCAYCLSAHTYLGGLLAKLDDAEMTANRGGRSNELKADVAVRFAVKVVKERGHLDVSELEALRSAGYDQQQIVELVLHVALNTWTNYINVLAATEIDFPVVPLPGKAA